MSMRKTPKLEWLRLTADGLNVTADPDPLRLDQHFPVPHKWRFHHFSFEPLTAHLDFYLGARCDTDRHTRQGNRAVHSGRKTSARDFALPQWRSDALMCSHDTSILQHDAGQLFGGLRSFQSASANEVAVR